MPRTTSSSDEAFPSAADVHMTPWDAELPALAPPAAAPRIEAMAEAIGLSADALRAVFNNCDRRIRDYHPYLIPDLPIADPTPGSETDTDDDQAERILRVRRRLTDERTRLMTLELQQMRLRMQKRRAFRKYQRACQKLERVNQRLARARRNY